MSNKKLVALAALLTLLSFSAPVFATFQEGTPPTGSDGGVLAVAAGSDKYVAVGLFSNTYHSTDGINWSKQSVPDNGMTTFKNFRDIAFGGGRFIGVTQQSVIYSSTDGENWTGITVPNLYTNGPDLTAATYNGTRYFVTANHSDFDFVTFQTTSLVQVLESSDGLTWTEAGTASDVQAQSLGWDGSQLIMGTNSGDILTSADGVTWAKQTDVIAANDIVTAIASNESNLTVATGWHRALITSPDGQNWTAVNHRNTASELIYGWDDTIWTGSEFIIVSDDGIVSSSSDGSTWTDDETFIGQVDLNGVASIGGQAIAVGSKPKTGGGSLPVFIYEGALSVTANVAPTVNAGTDQSVIASDTVALSGTASDSDGSIATFLWQQTVGTAVTLSATDAVDSSFTAPDVTTTETLTFSFTATDDSGDSGTDTVDITVSPASSGTNPTNTGGTTSTSDNSSGSSGSTDLLLILLLSGLMLRRKRQSDC